MTALLRAPSRRRAVGALAATTATLLLTTLLATVPASAATVPASAATAPASAASGRSGCEHGRNATYARLLRCVTVAGVRTHLEAFQRIADANGGTRASGTPGYTASADYVAGLLTAAGYEVTRQELPFPYFQVDGVTLEQTAPAQVTYETSPLTFSPSGDVTGPVTAVDLALEGERASTSGCEPEDFAGVDLSGSNDVVLLQRGACTFASKALNAQEAGAEAVVIFNQGTEDRLDLYSGTLGVDAVGVVTIPVVAASFDTGVALSAPGVSAHVAADTLFETRTTENVIAQSRGGDTGNVVMAGAHLDSVQEGPGIDDDGSGAAALLETALMMAGVRPVNALRFAWWGAEEAGLVGSTHYVEQLSDDEAAAVALYQNYDMIGSPNFIYMVYDADETTYTAADFGVEVPEGSVAIEDLYERFYTWTGTPYDDTAFSGRSDYQAFIERGIPSGGLFTGAEQVKTQEQQEIWGGQAGAQFDPCYHQPCDTIANVDDEALGLNSDLVAFAMLTYAYSTEDVNGVEGRRVPGRPLRLPPPAGPQGTFADGDGGAHPRDGA